MKKLFAALLFLGFCSGVAHARTDENVRLTGRVAKYTFTGITASTSSVLIDLSDQANFRHQQTGEVVITGIRVVVDKVAASSGTVRLGVVSAVSATNGTVKYFYEKPFEKDTVGTHLVEWFNINPVPVRTIVDSAGLTPGFVSNVQDASDTTYQTDVRLNTPVGTTFPAVGDIIFRLAMAGTTALNCTVEVYYYTEK